MKIIVIFLFLSMPYCPAPVSGGINFDRDDDGVSVGDVAVESGSGLTIYVVLTPQTINYQYGGIFTKYTGALGPCDTDCGPNFQIDGTNSTGRVRFAIKELTIWNEWETNTVVLSSGTQARLAVTYNESTDPIFYLNGVSVAATQVAGVAKPTIPDTAVDAYIGGFDNPPTDVSDCTISQLYIWDEVLTANQIVQISSASLKRFPLQVDSSNLIACWDFDDQPSGTSASGDTVVNRCGSNNGTGDDGADNVGLSWEADQKLSYQ